MSSSAPLVPTISVISGLIQATESFSQSVQEAGKLVGSLLTKLVDIQDEQLLELRGTARRLGVYAWVLECACDAEIWERHRPFKPAPGRADTEGIGLVPAVRARAREIGCDPQTIRRNYRIFRTFKDRLYETLPILPEKEFYYAALKHKENPSGALDLFIQERRKNPHFRPADAKKLLEKSNVQQKVEQIEAADESVKHHVGLVISRINEFKRGAPDKRLVTSYYEEWCRQLEEYLEDYSLSASEEKVLRAIERGHHKESQIISHTRLPAKTVSLVLLELERRGECESVLQRGETEVARGGHIKLWHRKGDPTGDNFEFRTPQISFFADENE